MIPGFIIEHQAKRCRMDLTPPVIKEDGVVIGEVVVPDGKSGPWAVETFEIDERGARVFNMDVRWNSRMGSVGFVYPGTYKRLVHKTAHYPMMSNTHMERHTNREPVREARGSVLINGLGLGMVLTAILKKPKVHHVSVCEIDEDIIRLVAPSFEKEIEAGRVRIIHADALTRKLAADERYEYVWHDIWPSVNGEVNGRQARVLQNRARNKSGFQGVWCREYWRL